MPKRLYNTTAWRKVSRAHLQRHPLCVYCEARGKITAANVVDHVVPHRGDLALFWDKTNLASACIACHNSKSASNEKVKGCRADGSPLDYARQWKPDESKEK